jgi:predicted enzyme related to lactoylglutathione lyase
MVASHGRFVWYELRTTDLAAAKSFYGKVLGWGAQDEAILPGVAYGFFRKADAAVGGLLELPLEARQKGVTPHWMGYVAVDDVDVAATQVQRLGGMVPVPPADTRDISRFAVIADPQQATLAVVKGTQPEQEPTADLDTPGRAGWHELLAADWEQAFAFYSALFGWQKADAYAGVMGTYQQFSVGGVTFGGMFTKPAMLPHPFWLYYFNSGDVEAAAKRVEEAGGQVLYGPLTVPSGARIVQCTDPQGAIFGLTQRDHGGVGYFASAGSRDRWSW